MAEMESTTQLASFESFCKLQSESLLEITRLFGLVPPSSKHGAVESIMGDIDAIRGLNQRLNKELTASVLPHFHGSRSTSIIEIVTQFVSICSEWESRFGVYQQFIENGLVECLKLAVSNCSSDSLKSLDWSCHMLLAGFQCQATGGSQASVIHQLLAAAIHCKAKPWYSDCDSILRLSLCLVKYLCQTASAFDFVSTDIRSVQHMDVGKIAFATDSDSHEVNSVLCSLTKSTLQIADSLKRLKAAIEQSIWETLRAIADSTAVTTMSKEDGGSEADIGSGSDKRVVATEPSPASTLADFIHSSDFSPSMDSSSSDRSSLKPGASGYSAAGSSGAAHGGHKQPHERMAHILKKYLRQIDSFAKCVNRTLECSLKPLLHRYARAIATERMDLMTREQHSAVFRNLPLIIATCKDLLCS